jgi:hypothetical protein
MQPSAMWKQKQRFAVQGQASDELPEQLLGTVRLDHLDLGAATRLHLPDEPARLNG